MLVTAKKSNFTVTLMKRLELNLSLCQSHKGFTLYKTHNDFEIVTALGLFYRVLSVLGCSQIMKGDITCLRQT